MAFGNCYYFNDVIIKAKALDYSYDEGFTLSGEAEDGAYNA